MKKILLLIVKCILGIILIINLILNIKILNSTKEISDDIYIIDYSLSSMGSDIKDLKDNVTEISYDVDYIKYYMD